jgi:hypothetical protein
MTANNLICGILILAAFSLSGVSGQRFFKIARQRGVAERRGALNCVFLMSQGRFKPPF